MASLIIATSSCYEDSTLYVSDLGRDSVRQDSSHASIVPTKIFSIEYADTSRKEEAIQFLRERNPNDQNKIKFFEGLFDTYELETGRSYWDTNIGPFEDKIIRDYFEANHRLLLSSCDYEDIYCGSTCNFFQPSFTWSWDPSLTDRSPTGTFCGTNTQPVNDDCDRVFITNITPNEDAILRRSGYASASAWYFVDHPDIGPSTFGFSQGLNGYRRPKSSFTSEAGAFFRYSSDEFNILLLHRRLRN